MAAPPRSTAGGRRGDLLASRARGWPWAAFGRGVLLALAAIVALTALAALLRDRLYPGGDALYALGWGDQILSGSKPNFEVWAPAKHPLTIGLGAIQSLFPPSLAIDLVIATSILSFVLLGYAVFRLGRQLAGAWAGALAALVVLTRPEVIKLLASAQKDLAFAAPTLLAASLFAEDPRRRWKQAMLLLVLAGLIRPEAWVLGGLVAIWVLARGPRADRPAAIALALAAPLAWGLFDLALTGNPLDTLLERGSRGDTLGGAAGAAAHNSIERLRDVLDAGILDAVTIGVVLGALVALGIFAALRLTRERRGEAEVPAAYGWLSLAALLLVGIMTLVITVRTGTATAARFLLVPAVALVICWAALIGFAASTRFPAWVRGLSAAGLAAGLVALALAAPGDLDEVRFELDLNEFSATVFERATDLAREPAVQAEADECEGLVIGPPGLGTASARIPIALELGVTLQDILVRPIDEGQAPGTGVFYGGGELAPAPEDLGEPVASAGDWSFYGCS